MMFIITKTCVGRWGCEWVESEIVWVWELRVRLCVWMSGWVSERKRLEHTAQRGSELSTQQRDEWERAKKSWSLNEVRMRERSEDVWESLGHLGFVIKFKWCVLHFFFFLNFDLNWPNLAWISPIQHDSAKVWAASAQVGTSCGKKKKS